MPADGRADPDQDPAPGAFLCMGSLHLTVGRLLDQEPATVATAGLYDAAAAIDQLAAAPR